MIYRSLGNTSEKLSIIGLGTMTWGEQNTEQQAFEQLDYALSAGINFIDTAEMYPVPVRKETYGGTETILGNWLKQSKKRNEIFLATKIAGPGIAWVRQDEICFSPSSIDAAIQESLNRLQTDYIDLYQIHWPERRSNFFSKRSFNYHNSDPWIDNISEVLACLKKWIDKGAIRYIGISNETPWGANRYLELAKVLQLPRIQSVQNPYNLLNRQYEIGLAEIGIREQLSLLAYSPLAFGMLSGKYHRIEDVSKARLTLYGDRLPRYSHPNADFATQKYVEVANKYGISMPQMALAFILKQGFLTSAIIGTTTMQQLKENIGSLDLSLSDEVMQEIQAIAEQVPDPAP